MKRNICYIISAVLLAAGIIVTMNSGTREETADAKIKLEASQKLEECFEYIKQLRSELNMPFTEDDIHETGLIGQEYSFITTTLGNLEAKRTTVNPNWAAVITDMFSQLGLKRGNRIAVNCSGSFPALNLAVLCASQAYGLDPVIISSFGASTHGANEPELTYQDMEHALYEKGIIDLQSRYFSIGGRKDVGGEMDPELVKTITGRLKSYGYEFLYEEDLIENIHMRYELYNEEDNIRCFINVGGNDVSFGDSKIIVYADGGILTDLPDRDRSTGLVQLFLRDGVPVIHLLNIKSIAAQYGIPVDPERIPAPGEGDIYTHNVYSRTLAAIFLISGFIPLVTVYVKDKKKNA